MWDIIRVLVAGGTTLLLTTQYLDEADELADEIVVIDHGRVIAAGTAQDLKDRVGGDVVEFMVTDRGRVTEAVDAVAKRGEGEPHVDAETAIVSVGVGSRGSDALVEAVRGPRRRGHRHERLALRRPSLDDVFLALTGHATDEPRIRAAAAVAVAAGPFGIGDGRRPVMTTTTSLHAQTAGYSRASPDPAHALRPVMRHAHHHPAQHSGLGCGNPPFLVFTIVQPVMFVLLFRYVFGGAINVPTCPTLCQFPDAGDHCPVGRIRHIRNRHRPGPGAEAGRDRPASARCPWLALAVLLGRLFADTGDSPDHPDRHRASGMRSGFRFGTACCPPSS